MSSIGSTLKETVADEPFDTKEFFIGPSNTDDLTITNQSFEPPHSITDGTNNKVFHAIGS